MKLATHINWRRAGISAAAVVMSAGAALASASPASAAGPISGPVGGIYSCQDSGVYRDSNGSYRAYANNCKPYAGAFGAGDKSVRLKVNCSWGLNYYSGWVRVQPGYTTNLIAPSPLWQGCLWGVNSYSLEEKWYWE